MFWALFGAIYRVFGMPEVYRVLFEVFGMDPEDEDCQPNLRRQLEDVDYVSVEFESKSSAGKMLQPIRQALFCFLLFVYISPLESKHKNLIF